MKHIQLNDIEAALAIVDQANDDQLEAGIDFFSKKQPILLDYVLSASSEYENEALEGYLLYYFWVINESFHQAGIEPGTVTEAQIDAFQEPFNALLDEYFGEDGSAAEQMLEEFSDQPHLIQFMAAEVSTDDEDGTSMDDETATQLFIVCMAMITLLSQANLD
jgi:hypothetical protein